MPSAGSNDPTFQLESGASSGMFALIRASSSVARTAEANSQLPTLHLYACWKVDPTVMTPCGPGIFSLR